MVDLSLGVKQCGRARVPFLISRVVDGPALGAGATLGEDEFMQPNSISYSDPALDPELEDVHEARNALKFLSA